MDDKPTVRRLKLVALLANSRFPKNRRSLSAALGKSRKTVSRDLAELTVSLGFDIAEDVRANGEVFYSLTAIPEWLTRALRTSPCTCGRHVAREGSR